MDKFLTEYLFQKGVQLAYLIYPCKEVAVRITIDAMKKWKVYWIKQERRSYDTLKAWLSGKRGKSHRRKIRLNPDQLFQQLILVCSDNYEKEQELHQAVDKESMIIRYIKHIIAFTLNHHALYATVGISRVLHKYSNLETINMYQALDDDCGTQDIDDIDRECKRYKREIMESLKERFWDFVSVRHTKKNEERFEPVTISQGLVELVCKSLYQFLPWGTECIESLAEFGFNGGNLAGKAATELKRIHALIHHSCYEWLAAQLDLDPPIKRLEIPQFILSSNGNGSKDRVNRWNPPDLSGKFDRAVKELKEYDKQRNNSSPKVLSVIVDGIEKGQIDLNKENEVHIQLSERSRLLEVYEKGTDLLLASLMLAHDGAFSDKEPEKYIITLEGGQRLNLSVTCIPPIFLPSSAEVNNPAEGNSEDDSVEYINGKFLITVSYRETNPIRAAKLFWKRIQYKSSQLPWSTWPSVPSFVLLGTIALFFFSFILYFQFATLKQDNPFIGQINQVYPPRNPPASPLVNPQVTAEDDHSIQTDNRQISTVKPNHNKSQSQHVSKNSNGGKKDPVRDGLTLDNSEERGTNFGYDLSSVHYIAVDELGDDSWDQQLRNEIIEQLKANGKLEVVKASDINKVYALLTLSATSNDTIFLQNLQGRILWEKKFIRMKDTSATVVASEIVNNLVESIEKATNGIEKVKGKQD